MSSHGGQSHTGTGRLTALSLETANSLSWMLGERVTEDDRTTLLGRWGHDAARESIAAYEVTDETAILRHTSPVGRERYVGTTQAEADAVLDALDSAPDWRRVEK